MSKFISLARRAASTYRSTLPVLGGGGPIPAPFARTAAPTRQLNEDHELIWDDGVAAETCIDFDAPHLSKNEGAQWWFAGMGFFATLGVFLTVWDAPGRKRTITRTLPFNNLALELGADPNGATEEADEE